MKRKLPQRILLATAWRTYESTLGVVQYANEAGWHLDLTTFISGELPEDWKGEGIITLLGEHKELTQFIKYQLKKVPTVSMSVNNHDLDIPFIDVDNQKVGQIAARHFIERDFRNYAFYSHNDWPVSKLRRNSYKAVIKKHNLSYKDMIWSSNKGRRKDTWSNREQWLMKELSELPKPLAVFAVDDMRAVEVIEACMQLQFRIPDDVAILGVGNSEIFSSSTIVPLSSISIESRRIGYEAARILDCLIQGEIELTKPDLLKPSEIKIRRSTDTIATEHPGLARAIRFILDNYHNDIGVDDIVESSNMSQTSLYQLFRINLNQSPARFLTGIRLKKAKHLIRESDLKISSIADKCGFGSSINLFRTFRKYEGTSPNQYRENINI